REAPAEPAAPAAGTAAEASVAGGAPVAPVAPARKTVLDYIDERTIVLDVDETDRDAMIRTLAGLMGATGRVQDEAAVVRAAFDREEHGTTGIGDGIAIPHAKSDGVTSPVLAFARSRTGIDWKLADGSKATLIFMIAVPAAAAGTEHLKVLAQLSRALMKPAFRAAIQAAETPADVLEALAVQVGARTGEPTPV
ncbi:PTS sugar transporter subunit IIA, partial [Cryobacterium sp. TMT3-29-2]|uniref:PTS sugar transporter subunit IIA n=1 Tax=Cryobacterium sp. TMT3-29-2 TaxID=2555867 RepID=UPI0010FFD576